MHGTPAAHHPVLLAEAVAALAIDAGDRRDGVYVDAHLRPRRPQPRDPRTARAGGAADRARPRSAGGRGCARDHGSALQHRARALQRAGARARRAAASAQVQGVLADLGVSSPQLDDAARGFSFRADGPLDMRMDPTRGVSAADWLATATEQQMREVIGDYGEERFAKQIAKAIVAARAREPLRRTEQLAAIVAAAVRTRERRARIRRRAPFRLYGFSSIGSLRRSR